VVNGEEATIYYNLPVPPDGRKKREVEVLPIDTSGGAGVTTGRTFEFAFALTF